MEELKFNRPGLSESYIEAIKLRRTISLYRSEVDQAKLGNSYDSDYVVPLIVINRLDRYEALMDEMIAELAFELNKKKEDVVAYITHLESRGLIISEDELKAHDSEISEELSILW